MVILAVHQRDSRAGMFQMLAEGQPAEARPKHHHMLPVFHAGLFYPGNELKTTRKGARVTNDTGAPRFLRIL
jgi:hypothetical protein